MNLFNPAQRKQSSQLLAGLTSGVLVAAGLLISGAAPANAAGRPGRFDTSFSNNTNGGLNGQGSELAIQDNGKIVVSGDFTRVGRTKAHRIARFNASGTPNRKFNRNIGSNGGLNGWAASVALQNSGRIVTAGSFTRAGRNTTHRIARFNANGTPNKKFNRNINTNGGLNETARSLAVQDNGKIVVTGWFTTAGGALTNRIASFNAGGTPNAVFNNNIVANGGLDNTGSSLAVQDDGKIVVTGWFTAAGGALTNRIARFNANGTPDAAFNNNITVNGGLNEGGGSVVVQPDGKILVTGEFTAAGGAATNGIARFNANGTPDVAFNNVIAANGGLGGDGASVAAQADGKITVTGDFFSVGGEGVLHVGRFNADGTPDTRFNTNISDSGGLNNFGSSVAMQANGKILLTGGFTHAGGRRHVNRIARVYGKYKQHPVAKCASLPKKLPASGRRTLVDLGCQTNAGQLVGVKVVANKSKYDLVCKAPGEEATTTGKAGYGRGFRSCPITHELRIRTKGQWGATTITLKAPLTDSYTKYLKTRGYRR
ncbi:MAG: hypothetical protein U0990_06165 [Candidatus Nanopelagicales bacterium]|nr:hypothetical protein [Candidatus Nanopelagicales bacterium]MDZ4249658.1 hypothetical protein [Candidatus Nanopelagicales bacterium]